MLLATLPPSHDGTATLPSALPYESTSPFSATAPAGPLFDHGRYPPDEIPPPAAALPPPTTLGRKAISCTCTYSASSSFCSVPSTNGCVPRRITLLFAMSLVLCT